MPGLTGQAKCSHKASEIVLSALAGQVGECFFDVRIGGLALVPLRISWLSAGRIPAGPLMSKRDGTWPSFRLAATSNN